MPKFGTYECPTCGQILREVPVDFGVKFTDHHVTCPSCEGSSTTGQAMDWLPQIGRMSAGGGPTFTSFETTGPDGKLTRINSITELRAMERRAEQMSRNGEGQPMVWRDFSNDVSNKDEHAITKNWAPDDYPGIPGKAQREALRTLTQSEGEAKLVEMQKAAAEIASSTAPPVEV